MRGTITITAGTITARSEWRLRVRHRMRTACTSTATQYTAMAVAVMGLTGAELHENHLYARPEGEPISPSFLFIGQQIEI